MTSLDHTPDADTSNPAATPAASIASAPIPSDDEMFKTYYAVPVKRPGTSSDSDLERCIYFDTNWIAVDANKLKANVDQDLVRIRQVESDALPSRVFCYVETLGYVVNPFVSLFSATALTLEMLSDPITNEFLAQPLPYWDANGAEWRSWYVVIPVASKTRRGVILMFRYPALGLPVKLIATADPEVEGGSSN